MNFEKFSVSGVPAIIYGGGTKDVFLFVHGQSGYKEEAEGFAELAVPSGFDVVSIDLPEHGERALSTDASSKFVPWDVVPELQAIMKFLRERYLNVSVRATSVGAWFCMQALRDEPVDRCLFVSPVVDMEELIRKMMTAAGVDENRLRLEKTITTGFGPDLSWDYLCYAKSHPVRVFAESTSILYGEHDAMISRESVERFAEYNRCDLTVMPGGEHWFHTEEQLAFMRAWEQNNLSL